MHNQDSIYLPMSLPVSSFCIAITIVHMQQGTCQAVTIFGIDDQEGIELPYSGLFLWAEIFVKS